MFLKSPKPIRDKQHMMRVAELPCCICGLEPSGVAHHLLRTDEKCASRKSGDDKTIPICFADHDALHRAGDETEFLSGHGIEDVLGMAAVLYQETISFRKMKNYR